MDTGLYLRNMKEKDEDWCEALLKHENYALVVDSITFESCLHAEARCQLRTVGETLFTNYIALGLQKRKYLIFP